MKKMLYPLSMAALVWGGVGLAHAGQVGVGVSAGAIDTPDGYLSQNNSASQNEMSPPVASAMTGASAGSSFSQAEADGSGLTGAMHMSLFAATSDPSTGPVPGRGASAEGSMSMTGSITLSSGLPSGTATFTAVLEGLFNGGPADIGFGNLAEGMYDFSASIDNFRGQTLGGTIDFIGGQAGSFYIPMSITLPVNPGDVVYFELDLLTMSVETTAGSISFDASNTFKITDVDLPPGYTYTPDAQGFLSEFTPTAPVPEPSTWALSLMGLGGVVVVARRRRP